MPLTEKAAAKLAHNLAGIADHPVAVAVRPLREKATDAAEKYAREVVANVAAEMEKFGWNRDAAAPYPSASKMGKADYIRAKNRYFLFHRLTREVRPPADEDGYIPMRPYGAPCIVAMAPAEVEKFVTECQNDAGHNYDAFVIKLVGKIGAAQSATLNGNSAWEYSILAVTKPNGEVQNWKTQQIINTSVRGLMFNQWPTRMMKPAKAA